MFVSKSSIKSMFMKHYFIVLAIIFCTACGSDTVKEGKATNQEETSESAGGKEQSQESATDNGGNPMEALAGTWIQDPPKEVDAKSPLSLAKMELKLNADGSYEGHSSMMNKEADVQGNWRLEGDIISIKWDDVTLSLEVDQSMQRMEDASKGVVLTK
jgi:hypothetical protein